MSGWRSTGGWAIDRSKPLSFTFDGRLISGFEVIALPQHYWRRASEPSAAALNTTARADSGALASRNPMAWPIFRVSITVRMCR